MFEDLESPGTSTRTSNQRSDLLCLLLIVVLAAAFLWRVVFLGHILLPLDVLFKVEPWASESGISLPEAVWNPVITDSITTAAPSAESSREGWRTGSPFWDPDNDTGAPGLARGGAFSNPLLNLLTSLIPVVRAVSVLAVLYLALSGGFVFLLLREMRIGRLGATAGAVVFAFNTYHVGWLSLPFVSASWVWIGFVFLAFERSLRTSARRWVALGGLGLALQVLDGYPLWALYCGATLALLAAWRAATGWDRKAPLRSLRPAVQAAGILVLGAALTAPLTLIRIELRAASFPAASHGADHFLPLPELGRLLVPGFWGSPLHGGTYQGAHNPAESGLYLGLVSLVFIAAAMVSARRRLAWGLGVIGLLTLLAAFGLPVIHGAAVLLFPGFKTSFPARLFYVTTFTLSIAAGIGVDWLATSRPARFLRTVRNLCWASAAAGLLASIASVLVASPEEGRLRFAAAALLSPDDARVRGLLVLTALLALLAAGLHLWLSDRHHRWVPAATVGLLVVDLFVAGWGFNPDFPPEMAFPETPSLRALTRLGAAEGAPFRILALPSGKILPGDVAAVFGLPAISSFSSDTLIRHARYLSLISDSAAGSPGQGQLDDCCHPLLDALNVRFVYSARDTLPSEADVTPLLDILDTADISSRLDDAVFPTRWTLDGEMRSVLYQHPTSMVRFRMTLRGPAVFETAVAMAPPSWDRGGDGVLFEVYAGLPQQGIGELIFSRYIDPKSNQAERTPIPVRLDLERWAGVEFILTLLTKPGPEGDLESDWAGWVEPRIRLGGGADLELIFDGPNRIYRNRRALDRAWLVHHWTEVDPGDIDSASERLLSPAFDPLQEAVVEGALPAPGGQADADDGVRMLVYDRERVGLRVRARDGGLVILSDAVYPGWRATVDGVEQPILATNLVMRGVHVEPGEHDVRFEYVPRTFCRGLPVSLIALAFMAAALVLPRGFRVGGGLGRTGAAPATDSSPSQR